MGYYPVNLDLGGKTCLVVGGGKVALRKILSLLRAGARVRVVAQDAVPEVEKLRREGSITLRRGFYETGDLQGVFLVIAATDDRNTNSRVFEEANERGILINVVDEPAQCNFIVPASVVRGDLCISVSTGGKSPMLSRRIREELEKIYTGDYADFVDFLGEARRRVLREVGDPSARREIFRRLVYGDVAGHFLAGRRDTAKRLADELIDESEHGEAGYEV